MTLRRRCIRHLGQQKQYKCEGQNGRQVRGARGRDPARDQGWRTRMAADPLKQPRIIDGCVASVRRPCVCLSVLQITRYSGASGSKVDHRRARVDHVLINPISARRNVHQRSRLSHRDKACVRMQWPTRLAICCKSANHMEAVVHISISTSIAASDLCLGYRYVCRGDAKSNSVRCGSPVGGCAPGA